VDRIESKNRGKDTAPCLTTLVCIEKQIKESSRILVEFKKFVKKYDGVVTFYE